jgi:hypothetical protein
MTSIEAEERDDASEVEIFMIHLSDTSIRGHFNCLNSSSHMRLENFLSCEQVMMIKYLPGLSPMVSARVRASQNRSAVMCHRVRQQPAGTTFGFELTAVSHTERRSADKG